MDQAAIQQLMAQYLRGMQGQPQTGQQPMMQGQNPMIGQTMQQPMQMGGFMKPQMPQGGMGSMQGQMAPQQGIIRA